MQYTVAPLTCLNVSRESALRVWLSAHMKSFENILCNCLSGSLLVLLPCVCVCVQKQGSPRCVVTVCWPLSSRTPETSLEMEKEAVTSGWSSPQRQWLCAQRAVRRHPVARTERRAEPGKARSRCVGGWVDGEGAAAAVFNGEPRRARTGRSPDAKRVERFQHRRAWTATRSSPELSRARHGSHLDSVRREAQKWECQVQSASRAQGWQLRLVIVSCEYTFCFFFFLFVVVPQKLLK